MGWSHDLQSLSNTFLRLLLAACGLARSPDQGNKTPDRVPGVEATRPQSILLKAQLFIWDYI